MTAPMKSAVAVLALMGAVLGSAVLAEQGPGDMGETGGPEGRGAMLLKKFDAIDTDKDGKLSLAELEADRKAEFAKTDTNGDGKLSAEELSARELARFNETIVERTGRMIQDLDSNDDGAISADEAGLSPLERRFKRADADNDGAISMAEAKQALKHHRRHGQDDAPGEN